MADSALIAAWGGGPGTVSGVAFFAGSPAPDALRPDYEGVGQAVHPHRAAGAHHVPDSAALGWSGCSLWRVCGADQGVEGGGGGRGRLGRACR